MTAADRVVRERLADGPIGFDVFMDIALYDPDVGFYATTGRAGGRAGDFITSPETGPLFGVLVGRYLDRVWRDLSEPDGFTFVDAGAGPGTLARAVLAAEPECSNALRIVCVEVSAAQRALHPDGVESRADWPEEPVTGVIFANELLDNLPFRIAERIDGEWGELLLDGASLVHQTLDDATRQRCERVVGAAVDGMRIPITDRAGDWVPRAIGSVERGTVVAIDYGGSTAQIAERTMDGWLRTFRGHGRGSDPLTSVGEQDITADVPFDQLPAPDRRAPQADWLAGLDIDDLVEQGRRTWTERAGVGDLAALTARSRINEAAALTNPSGLGGFSVLEWDAG